MNLVVLFTRLFRDVRSIKHKKMYQLLWVEQLALLLRNEEFSSKLGRQSNNMTNVPHAFTQMLHTNNKYSTTGVRKFSKNLGVTSKFLAPNTDGKQVQFRGTKNIRSYGTKFSRHGDLSLRNLATLCYDISHIIYNLSSTNHSYSKSMGMES